MSGGKRVRKEEKRRKKDDAERARIKTESRASASAIREANVASFSIFFDDIKMHASSGVVV